MKSGDVLVWIITFSFLHTTFLKTGAFLESIIPTVDLYCSSLELDFTNIHPFEAMRTPLPLSGIRTQIEKL